MVRRSRSIPLPEPASLTNSLKICERCRLGALGRGRSPRIRRAQSSRCPPCADGDFTASSKQAHFPTAVASDHLRSSSYGASANLARSRHSGATAERRPYLPAELLCDMEMQKVRQSHLPMPPGGQPHLERLFRGGPDKALKYRADLSN
jgi:hypothetical protein